MSDGSDQSGFHCKLTATTEARKRAEQDFQLLANRIGLLRKEEERAWQSIYETRKRTREILEIRYQKEQHFLDKARHDVNQKAAIRDAQARNALEREKAREKKSKEQDALNQNKRATVRMLKQQKLERQLEKEALDAEERRSKQEQSAALKQQREETQQQLGKSRLCRLDMCDEQAKCRSAQLESGPTTRRASSARAANRNRRAGSVDPDRGYAKQTSLPWGGAAAKALLAQMELEELKLAQRLQISDAVRPITYEQLVENLPVSSSQPALAIEDAFITAS